MPSLYSMLDPMWTLPAVAVAAFALCRHWVQADPDEALWALSQEGHADGGGNAEAEPAHRRERGTADAASCRA